MPNNYGIIVCDSSRTDNAKSLGRNNKIINNNVQTWRCDTLSSNAVPVQKQAKYNIACDGNFTGHCIILMHGNYNVNNTKGYLYYEENGAIVKNLDGKLIDYAGIVVAYVNDLPNLSHVYIYACGQGAPNVLTWYRGADGFNINNVWSPCTTASMGGVNPDDIKLKFGL